MSEAKGKRASGRRSAAGRDGGDGGFTEDEKAAMKERAREVKRARAGGGDGESELLEKISVMPEPDRTLAGRIHSLVKEHAPSLTPRTWYGMPAWARDGKVACFFQGAHKFKARYATLGFNDAAALDDGTMWPTAFAILEITPAEEARIVELLKRAVG